MNDNKKSGVKIGNAKRTGLGGKEENPGPGEYTYDKRPYSAGPKYGFGRAGRGTNQVDNPPGPGQYEANSFLKSG